jgi:glucokinase
MSEATAFVLGMDFGGTKVALATADRRGRILAEERMPTDADRGARQAVGRAVEAGRRLIAATEARYGGRLAAVGVSSMGNTYEDHVVMAPNVAGWGELALPAMLREGLRTDAVTIANDVKAAAWAEVKWGSLRGVEAGIFVNVGTGFAAALVLDGRIVHGAHGAAGEIGYNLRAPGEPLGAADGRLPVEEFVGGHGVAARARERFGPETNVPELFARARDHAAERAFVEEFVSEVAFQVTNLVIAWDPGLVVLGGGFMESADLVLPGLQEHARRFAPCPPRVEVARFVGDGGLRGSIALALEPMQP